MTHSYGPWATAIDAGGSPQLSSFWRQRLTMLVAVSQASPAISRRSVALLVAAALLLFLLPTFRAAPAVAQQEAAKDGAGPKPAQAGDKTTTGGASNSYSGKTTITGGSITVAGGSLIITGSDKADQGTVGWGGPLVPEPMMGPAHPADLDFPFYRPLCDDRRRAELHLSPEQERKLHELNRKYLAELRPAERKLYQENDKATAHLPPDEKQRRLNEVVVAVHRQAAPVRRQVEALLTPQQLARLRMLVLIDRPYPTTLLFDLHKPATGEEAKERERLFKLEQEFQQETNEKTKQADRENDEKAVALLSPAQRTQVEREIAAAEAGWPTIFGQQLSFEWITPPGVGYVDYPPLWEFDKELRRSREQWKKLDWVKYKPAREMYVLFKGADPNAGYFSLGSSFVATGNSTPRLSPELGRKMAQPDFRQKVEGLKKQILGEIAAALRPEQLSTLKRLALQKAVARRVRDPEIPAALHPTEQQKAAMYQLFAAKAETETRLWREGNERFVQALTPQQRQKCLDELERNDWAW